MQSVNKLCDWIREIGSCDVQPNNRGNWVHRQFHSSERYIVDFAEQFKAEGWMQFDTDQDAHYFGFWVNPTTRTTLTYCEGDWSVVDCPTVETYNAEIESAAEFYGEGRIALVIHEDGSATEFRQDRAEFFIKG